jgi:hypothetical protein
MRSRSFCTALAGLGGIAVKIYAVCALQVRGCWIERMEGKSKGDDEGKRKKESSSASNRMEVMQITSTFNINDSFTGVAPRASCTYLLPLNMNVTNSKQTGEAMLSPALPR